VSYCSDYYGFYSTLQKAEQGMAKGQVDEDYSSFAEDWEIQEIELDE
jgi:hypothetical protein